MSKDDITRITKRCIPGVTLQPRDGYYQIRQIGLTAKRVKTDPAFSNSRKQSEQFAFISRLAGLINKALLPGTGIRKMMPRLTSLLHKAIDKQKATWCKSPDTIRWEYLKGFECNDLQNLSAAMQIKDTIQVAVTQQQYTISFPFRFPATTIYPPLGIAYARIFAISVVIDCGTAQIETLMRHTTLIPLQHNRIALKSLNIPISPLHQSVRLLALGIQWYGRHNPNGPLVRTDHPLPMAIISAGYDA